MFYGYVLKSLHDSTRYIGSTQNILRRLKEHNQGECRYTKGRRPWQLIYKIELPTRSEAIRQEKFFKSGQGRKFLDTLLG